MKMLIAGVILWSVVHLMKSVTPGLRGAIISKTGAGPHQGLVALSLVGAVILMVFGWRSQTPEFVYDPPSWGRHLHMLLMLISIFLFGAAQGKSRVKQWLRHPMLIGMLIFAGGHLLANGDNRSLVLFGGLGLWALVSIFTISRNEGDWEKPAEVASVGRELMLVIVSVVLYAILFGAHRWLSGVPLVGN